MKNCKKKLLGTLLACIFVSLMINSVINATMNSNLSEADEDIVLNEENPQQADDFDPPLPPDNDELKWDFSNGTNLGFHYEWRNDTESHAGYNYYNITSMPYLFLDIDEDEMKLTNFTYCVQLEEIYFNTTENKMMPVQNSPLLNVSLVNVTEDFFGSTGFFFPMIPSGGGGNGPPPGWYFMNINPFIPTNDTTLALTWSAERLKMTYENMLEMGELDIATTSIAPNNNNIYFENSTTDAYVNLTYYDNGILKYGELYSYDDEEGWYTITLTTIFDVNPIDDLEWDVEVGECIYWGIERQEWRYNITSIQNYTYYHPQFDQIFVLQVVNASLSIFIPEAEFWYVLPGNWPIAIANEYYPVFLSEDFDLIMPLLLPKGYNMEKVAEVYEMIGEDAEWDQVTFGDNWFELYNSSTKGSVKYEYAINGTLLLAQAQNMDMLFGHDTAGLYQKNMTIINGLQTINIKPFSTSGFNVQLNISVNDDTEVFHSAFDINPINTSSGIGNTGLLFIDVMVNESGNLVQAPNYSPINITIEFDHTQYNNMKLYWFNDTYPEHWQAIPFTDYGNGIIVFTVSHTSIFALRNIPPSTSGLVPGDGDDDGDDNGEEINAVMIIIIAIIGTVVLLSVGGFYVKKKIKTQKSPIGIKKKTRASLMPVKKKKLSKTTAAVAPLTEAEKEDLKKTESEVDVEKRKFVCVVHKGPIIGPNYLCPYCQTFYCVRCANALKEKGENCWSCEREIEL